MPFKTYADTLRELLRFKRNMDPDTRLEDILDANAVAFPREPFLEF